MHVWHIAKVMVLTLGLLGCSAPTQTFVEPDLKLPLNWSSFESTGAALNLNRQAWWQGLGLSELNGFVQEALAKNVSIQMALVTVDIAKSELETVKLGWLPSLNLLGGAASGNSNIFFDGLSLPVSNAGSFVAFLPTYLLDIFRRPYRQRQAQEVIEARQAQMIAIRLAIVTEVVNAYAIVLAADAELKHLHQLRRIQEKRQALRQSMQARGLGSTLLLNQVATEFAVIRSQEVLAHANRHAAVNVLGRLVQRPLGQLQLTGEIGAFTMTSEAPDQNPVNVIQSRPDLAVARSNVLALSSGTTITQNLLLPTLSFNALVSNISVENNNQNASSNANFTAGYAFWAINPEVFGLIKTADLRKKAALLEYIKLTDSALREVDSALVFYAASGQRLQAQQAGLASIQANVASTQAMQTLGLVSGFITLDFQAQRVLADMALVQAKLQRVIAYSAVNQTMGVGALFGLDAFKFEGGLVKENPTPEIDHAAQFDASTTLFQEKSDQANLDSANLESANSTELK
jgi:outer membrane protein TolC